MRILGADEWEKLTEIFRNQNWHLPQPDTAFALVEESEEGEIVFVQMCQLMMHAEPLWIREDHRGKVNWKSAGKMLEQQIAPNVFFPGIVVTATDKNTERMAEILGMRKVEGVVYVKEFQKAKAAVAEVEE